MAETAKIIYGGAGTGKTEKIMNIAQLEMQNTDVLILVPEQFSFEIERKLVHCSINSMHSRAEVLSFERLCENIFRQLGGIAADTLNSVSKLMLVFVAIQNRLSELKVYRRIKGSESSMLSSLDDMKRYGVSTEKLRSILSEGSIEDEYLKSKLLDILKIYEEYEILLGSVYCDPVDDILRALKTEGIHDFFREKTVLVDGFYHFTPMQWEFLELILCTSKSFCISILTDNLDYRKTDVFTVTKATIGRFVDICKRNLINLEYDYLEKSYRLGEGLQAVGDIAAGHNFREEDIDLTAVANVYATDSWEEIRYIAAEISRLCREYGYSYSDFAIIARDIEPYKLRLDSVFDMYNIPMFYSSSEELSKRAFFSYIKAMASIVVEGLSLELILRLARNVCSGIMPEEYFALENYCYMWNLDAKAFRTDFTLPTNGLDENFTSAQKANLAVLNNVRKRLISPAIRLLEDLQNATGNTVVKAFYAVATEVAVKNIKQLVQMDKRQEYAEHFDIFVDILDDIGRILGDKEISAGDAARIVILAIDNLKKSKIPNHSDCVMVVNADSSRLNSPKVVFVVGVNIGEFPGGVSAGGFFTSAEHIAMTNAGMAIRPDNIHRAIIERLYLYIALTQASDRVYVCTAGRTLSGEQLTPSSIISQLAKCGAREIVVENLDEVFFINNYRTLNMAYSKILKTSSEDSVGSVVDKIQLQEYKGLNEAVSIEKSVANILLGTPLKLSHSGIDKFFECPYKYFLDHMLRVFKRERVEDITALVSGNARHSVLERLLSTQKSIEELKKCTSYSEICMKINDELMAYVARCTDGAKLSARLNYGIMRLSTGIARFVERYLRESENTEFLPTFTEAIIDIEGQFSPILLNTEFGEVLVRGKIDRIDIAEKDKYFLAKVVDYKSSGKKIDRDDILSGRNMQLFIYLSAVCSDINSMKKYAKPAAIEYATLYHKPKEYAGEMSQENKNTYIDLALAGNLLYLDTAEVSAALAFENQSSKAVDMVSQFDFSQLFGSVYKNICYLTKSLYSGNISPVYDKKVCSYCNKKFTCKEYLKNIDK